MPGFQRQIKAAEGFISLGMLQEAWDILEALPRTQKVTKEVLVLHLEILVKSEEWFKAALLAESLCELDRKDAERHVQQAGVNGLWMRITSSIIVSDVAAGTIIKVRAFGGALNNAQLSIDGVLKSQTLP